LPPQAQVRAFTRCVLELLELWGRGSLRALEVVPVLRALPHPGLRKLLELVELRDAFVEAQIRKHEECPSPPRDTVLGALRDPSRPGPPLSAPRLHMALVDLFIGGTETTAAALAWAIAFLLHRPEVPATGAIRVLLCPSVPHPCPSVSIHVPSVSIRVHPCSISGHPCPSVSIRVPSVSIRVHLCPSGAIRVHPCSISGHPCPSVSIHVHPCPSVSIRVPSVAIHVHPCPSVSHPCRVHPCPSVSIRVHLCPSVSIRVPSVSFCVHPGPSVSIRSMSMSIRPCPSVSMPIH
ncbi:LOW QUALITY PROTEIN: steroid 21-hydroxylase-like, partial [Pezoporus occidentalis]|uniref:LOW QUALITY PROTEIN: steroid 21-hydroxylase-like n=1 Tax=Pezoporus occidentalis TaxID=407982 RepID=UPI002F90E0AA